MVLDLASSTQSLDLVNLFTNAADTFLLEIGQDGTLVTDIQWMNMTFSASFPSTVNCTTEEGCDKMANEFIWANDKIYWANGIFDYALYDGHEFQGTVGLVNIDEVVIEDGTKWADYVDRILEVLLIPQQQIFLLKPWFNAEEIALCA
jgi:hypothetical protein